MPGGQKPSLPLNKGIKTGHRTLSTDDGKTEAPEGIFPPPLAYSFFRHPAGQHNYQYYRHVRQNASLSPHSPLPLLYALPIQSPFPAP